ncbi:MAG: peptidase S1 [Actinomycetales bacterium]|nr:MAG: peptidase S1 [Actinomycetales bacterium]
MTETFDPGQPQRQPTIPMPVSSEQVRQPWQPPGTYSAETTPLPQVVPEAVAPPLPPADPVRPDRPRSSRSRRGGAAAAAAGIGLVAGLVGGGAATLLIDRPASSPESTVTGPSIVAPSPAGVPAPRPDGSIAAIAAEALPSVVTVQTQSAAGAGTGSGFVIDDDGHVLTNNHVVADQTSIVVVTHDGRELDATVVGRDASYDVAVLQVSARDVDPLPWGQSSGVVVGDPVVAVGAPLGFGSTVTSGIVSAVNRPVATGGGDDETSYINAIQTDAAINPGNSGGPLLDAAGHVVGINSAIARGPGTLGPASGNIGVGFAIPSDQAVKTARQLIATGTATHPIMGIVIDLAHVGKGVRVGDVSPGGPADEVGVRAGDVIVEFEDKRMTTVAHLVVAIRARDVGDTVRVGVQRAGQELDFAVTLQGSG